MATCMAENFISATAKVGTVRLVPGEYEIQVKPVDIRGGELMRLFSISLTPDRDGALARTKREANLLRSP